MRSATSRKPRSFRCERSSTIRSRLQARTSSRPAAVRPGPGVGRRGDAERDALAEGVRAAPDGPDRAQAALVERLEPAQLRVERLGALEVEDRADPVAVDAGRELRRRADDAHGTARRGLDREQEVDLRLREGVRVVGVERRHRRDLPAARSLDDELLERRVARDVDGEEPAREAARAGARQVEVPGDAAVEEALGPRAGRRRGREREQRVVVAVEDLLNASGARRSRREACAGTCPPGSPAAACSRTRRAAP